jgi:putative transcriptional regulator
MAVVKVTKKMAEQAARDVDWKKLDAMSDAQLESAARSDPDNRPSNERDLKRLAAAAMIRRIRKRIGLTQAGFARRYKVPVATLRDWEQGRRAPETTVIAYLKVIDRMPERVQAALAPSRPRRRQRAAT